jgi:hypothetical protein
VRRNSPFLLLAAGILLSGCAASPEKQIARMEGVAVKENSRLTEERRMRAMTYGEATSKRGAEVIQYDPTKKFEANRSGIGTARTHGTGGARVKDFRYEQKARTGNFLTRAFASKSNRAADRTFAAGAANTGSRSEIPNKDEQVGQKTATTKRLWDGEKVAATEDAYDGGRRYLGPESRKLNHAISATEMADWRSGGATESVSYEGSSVERMGSLKQLSVEDVRELLNTNK